MALWKLSVILIVSLCCAASTALGQESGESDSLNLVCDMRPNLVGALNQHYGERQIDWQLVNENSIYELFASDEGSWTILLTYTSGASCAVSAGDVRPWRDL